MSLIATRSPRRSGGRSWRPSASVDSQIGPSTRVGSRRRSRAGLSVDGPAERGERDDRMPRAVEGRPDQLGHPGIDDDLAARRDRGRGGRSPRASPSARRGPGRARSRGGAGAGPPGRASSRSGSSRAKRSGAGRRLVERQDREAAADIERVEGVEVRRAAGRPPRARAGPRRARHRRRGAASRRGGGSRAAGSASPAWRGRATRRGRSPRSRSCRTWMRPSPTASPAIVSGVTSGLSRTRTSSARPAAPAQAGPPGHARSRPPPRRRIRARPKRAAARRPPSSGSRPAGRHRSCRRPRA